METSPAYYRETQKFTQPFVLIVTLSVGLYMIFLGFRQILFHIPMDSDPTPDFIAWIMIVFGVLIGSFVFMFKLITEVRYDGLYVRFAPLHRSFQVIQFADIASYEAVTYRPIVEYGGWGIRYSKTGKAYNIKGNRGVMLTFTDGKNLLIGSQEPERICDMIRQVKK